MCASCGYGRGEGKARPQSCQPSGGGAHRCCEQNQPVTPDAQQETTVKDRQEAAQPKELEPLMMTEEVCSYLRMARGTLYALRSQGAAPPAFRVGKHLLHRRSDVVAWLEAHAEPAA